MGSAGHRTRLGQLATKGVVELRVEETLATLHPGCFLIAVQPRPSSSGDLDRYGRLRFSVFTGYSNGPERATQP